jgi:hypothetical protein
VLTCITAVPRPREIIDLTAVGKLTFGLKLTQAEEFLAGIHKIANRITVGVIVASIVGVVRAHDEELTGAGDDRMGARDAHRPLPRAVDTGERSQRRGKSETQSEVRVTRTASGSASRARRAIDCAAVNSVVRSVLWSFQ